MIIVPGWALRCGNGPASEWRLWLAGFAHAGYAQDEVEVFGGDRCQPNEQLAAQLGDEVDRVLARTGAAKIDLIAHSMGALPARWCVTFGSCAGKVANVVTLSGANHGTALAAFCPLQFWSKACSDMTPGSPMLAALNSGDETPDDAHWETFVSVCELVIWPRTSAQLAGADNHDLTDRCVPHDDWKVDAPTVDHVVGELAGAGVDVNPGPG